MPVIVQDPQGQEPSPAQAALQALRQDASRPAEVRVLSNAELAERKNFEALIDKVRQGNGAVLPAGDPVASHQVFGFVDIQRNLNNHLAAVPQGAELDYPPLPDAVARVHANVERDHTENSARDMWARSVRAREVEGELPVSRGEIRDKLGQHSPEVAAEMCRQYVEHTLWSNPDSVPGVSKEQLTELKILREKVNTSSASPEDKQKYTQLCEALVKNNLATFDKGLTEFAVRGMDPHKSAEAVYKIVQDTKLSDQQKREAIIKEVGNATPMQLERIASHYNGMAERARAVEMQAVAQELAKAEASKDSDKLGAAWNKATKLLSSLSPAEASKLEALSDQEAHKAGLTSFRDIAYSLKPENRDRLLDLARGFDAGRRVDRIIGAIEGGGTKNDWIREAIGHVPDPTGKTSGSSALTKQQLEALEAAWKARKFDDKPEEGTKLAEYIKSDMQLADLLGMWEAADVDAAFKNPTAPRSSDSNFYTDVSTLDPNLKDVSATVRSGVDIGLAQSTLHDRIDKFVKGKSDPEQLIGILEHGASADAKYYLSDDERFLLIDTHNQANPGQTVRDGLKARLEGDDLTRALLAHDLGFYATQQAEAVHGNLRHIANIGARASTLQELHDCIDQTDKQYKRFYGMSLESAVNASSLSKTEKEKLLAYVYLPRSVELGTELKKDSPDLGKIDSLIPASPAIIEAYGATHPGQPGLLQSVENLAKTGKAPWEGVAWTEAKVSGELKPETLELFWRGLNEGIVMERVIQLAPVTVLSNEEKAKALPFALITRTGDLHDELGKAKPNESMVSSALNGGLSDPKIMQAQYQRIFGADISADLYALAEKPEGGERKLSLEFVGAQQLRLAGIAPKTLATLTSQLSESTPQVGDKNSALRGLSPEQVRTVEETYNWVARTHAQDRGEVKFVSFTDQVKNLREDGHLSYDQVVRAAMLVEGADPWNLAANINKEPTKALDIMAGLDAQFKLQIAKVYREENKGVGIFTDFTNRQDSFKAAFTQPDDVAPWLLNVADTAYGADARQAAVDIESTLSTLRKDGINELEKAQGALALLGTLEGAYQNAGHLRTVAMYDDAFRTDDLGMGSAFYAHLDEAHAKGNLNDADYRRAIDLASGNIVEETPAPTASPTPTADTPGAGR